MTFLPLKNRSEYQDAYLRWKKDLEGILKKTNNLIMSKEYYKGIEKNSI